MGMKSCVTAETPSSDGGETTGTAGIIGVPFRYPVEHPGNGTVGGNA